MATQSVYQQAKELESQIETILSAYDVNDLPMGERNVVGKIKHELIDIRLDARDYEYAQTRNEQLHAASVGQKRLELLRQHILKASEYNLFGTVDIAQLSARIEQLISQLE